jgi:hypothetical protein
MSGNEPDNTVLSMPGSNDKITVFNPACSSSMTERIPLAPRTFSNFNNKKIFMVDIGWGGPKAAYDVFEVMQGWFAENIPSVEIQLVRKKGAYMVDDPDLWNRIKSEGDACIIGISC